MQIAAAAALAFVYFFLAPALRPWEPGGATVFLPMGDYERLAVFAAMVWALVAVCAVLTISSRPEGALLATLVGVAGFAFRSGPMRTLLWRWEGRFDRLFTLLSAEVLAMAAVAAGAVIVVRLVRAVAGRLGPKLAWSDPMETQRNKKAARPDSPKSGGTMHTAGAVLMETAVAILLLVITFRSTDRGQIAFALAASFFISALAAHQTFPIRISAPLWIAPIIMAALVFALGGSGGGAGPDWYAAQMVAKGLPLRAALPIDWLAFGAGGAVAGFWFSSRIREAGAANEETPKK